MPRPSGPAAGTHRRPIHHVVRQDGDPLAMIVHDAALDAEPGLVSAAGGAALMMLENARLEADLRASVADLRASRARLASAADAGRREIERNLHDGAQQRLVALRMRLADAEAQAAPDDELRRSLGELGADAEATIDELRSLAHGVYPAVLVDHGLASALTSVARRSPTAGPRRAALRRALRAGDRGGGLLLLPGGDPERGQARRRRRDGDRRASGRTPDAWPSRSATTGSDSTSTMSIAATA